MIELTEDSYIVGFWFSSDEDGNDWLCCIIKRKGESEWKGWFRTRERKDDKFANSDDVKRWVKFTMDANEESEDEVIKVGDRMQALASELFPFPERVLIHGGIQEMIEKTKNVDWFQTRQFGIIKGGKK